MNKMKDVAALLGVELNEKFKVKHTTSDENKETMNFILTENGLYHSSSTYNRLVCVDQSWLTDMLTGEIEIIHLPFKPKANETYFTPACFGEHAYIDCYEWVDSVENYIHYYLGLCFRTEEEAEANNDKLIKIINHYKED